MTKTPQAQRAEELRDKIRRYDQRYYQEADPEVSDEEYDRDLRERTWTRPTDLVLERADGRRVIEFGRDQIDPPFALHLQREGERVTIVSNGLGIFQVR